MYRNFDGQDSNFSGYGGIEDITKYVSAKYGAWWMESQNACIPGIPSFKQSELEENANNCTLASITRIMKYYSNIGYVNIPVDINKIYKKVREIGVKHGYHPKKSGLFRDLFIYTPWEIDNMVRDTWKEFGYTEGSGNNVYLRKLSIIKSNIDNFNPLLLNITFGDYEGHTVSVIGYKVFSGGNKKSITFVQIFDGWSNTIRYIDWKGLGMTPASVTFFMPPKYNF